jgi:hypothetical protein
VTDYGHGVYDDGRAGDMPEPRCPRCANWDVVPLKDPAWRWLCTREGCGTAFAGTVAEWDSMVEVRAKWASAQVLKAQTPPPPPSKPQDVARDEYPCRSCGKTHARRPDHAAPRPRTDRPGAARWTRDRRQPATPCDPQGRAIAWPHGTPDEPDDLPSSPLDPAAAEAQLLDDIDTHRKNRRTA